MLDNSQAEWELTYFQPGQIVFHVTGNTTDSLISELLDNANTFAKSNDLQISISNPRVQQFPSTPRQDPDTQHEGESLPEKPGQGRPHTQQSPVDRDAFALVFADVSNENGAELDNLGLIEHILLLDDQREDALGKSVQVVSPNWLTSGCPQPGGTGGPGGKPTPYTGPSDTREFEFSFDKLKSAPEFLERIKDGSGKGVFVAILDTAPHPNQLDPTSNENIYNNWVVQGNKNHSLIQTLLKPGTGRLTVHHDPRVETPPLSEIQCIDYDYDMNDHGLFVTGIIHSLAPQAELHLYQVLNRYGIGDLEVIGDALRRVIDDFKGKPFVVNLSLNINLPLEQAHTRVRRKNLIHDSIGEKIINYKSRPGDMSWLDRVARLAEWICDIADALGSRAIAAAGNDRKGGPGSQKPQARYPAAFDRVVGVGALPRSNHRPYSGSSIETASYSNLADSPARMGITTLGGEEGEGKGVLGIYTGDFPGSDSTQDGPPNTSGWAWWCGTSFATPIISGLVAAVLSSMIPGDIAATTQGAITELYKAQVFETQEREDVLIVSQGSPV